VNRSARVFFWLYLCAIVYLSLYPLEFALHAKASRLYWVPLVGRRQILDFVLNVFFYAPLGAAAFLSLRRGLLGWILACVVGGLLSWTIEWLQLWSPFRYGNLADFAANTVGAVLGASAAYVAVRSNWFPENLGESGWLSRWRLRSSGALWIILWMLWQLFPFIPALGLPRLTNLVSLSMPWSWRTGIEVFLGFSALRLAIGASPWLWVAYAALPAQAFLVDRPLSPSALIGAGLGWGAAELAGSKGIRWMAMFLPLWLVFEELRPFALATQRNVFAWAPFQSWYEASSAQYYPVLFGKLFLYLSVVWFLRAQRLGWRWAVGIPGLILAGGEYAQQFILGRTPETTDLVVLLAAAVLLALCRD